MFALSNETGEIEQDTLSIPVGAGEENRQRKSLAVFTRLFNEEITFIISVVENIFLSFEEGAELAGDPALSINDPLPSDWRVPPLVKWKPAPTVVLDNGSIFEEIIEKPAAAVGALISDSRLSAIF